MDRYELIHEVVKQIRIDIERIDVERGVPMPLSVMLEHLPDDVLAAYLPETE